AREIAAAVAIPVIGDGDTGYGNAMNVKRTVRGDARAGTACVMIEDQLAPKRCGHTRGKQVVPRAEALARVRAAVDAARELRAEGGDVLVMARTDARATHDLDEAIARGRAFAELGADLIFVEGPRAAAGGRGARAPVGGARGGGRPHAVAAARPARRAGVPDRRFPAGAARRVRARD